MSTRMQQRRGTAAQWISTNSGNGPILAPGEIGFETDTNKFKVGDGINHWVDLNYFADVVELGGSIDDYIPLTQKGANSGVATLDSTGKIPVGQLGNLIDGAPEALNTLNELAAAINDNENFAATIASTYATITYADGLISGHQSDTTSIHGIADTAELATKAFAAQLLVDATKSNITITGDKNGLTITAENGVADSNTDNLQEGSTNKYFTDERAQDAVGNAVGTGLSYNDTSGAISVDTTAIQAKVSGVSDTEIGYLDGVTSAIQTQIDSKLATSTAASTYAPIANPTFTGTVSGVTKSHVGLGNVDNTSDANKPISTATQSALDAKLNLSGGTLTGALTLSGAPTSDLHAATKLYVDNVTAGINFHEAVHATTTVNLATIYNNGTGGVGATLTADTNRAFTTIDGESVTLGQRVLIKNQTDSKQNGIYTLTTVGSGSTPWVLTRATDADNSPVGEMKTGDFTFVQNGTTFGGIGFINNSTANPIVIGTSNITYTEFNAAKTVVAGNGLQETTPGTLAIDTAVTADLSTAQTLTNKTLTTPTLTLSSTTSTATGRIAFDATNDKIIVGDGTSAIEFAPSTTLINAQSASYTLVAADKDKMVEMGVGSANNLTVPLNASVPYAIGTKITVVQTGTGQTTIAPTVGVTINGTPGLKLRAQWSAVTLVKRAENTWVAFGDLTA